MSQPFASDCTEPLEPSADIVRHTEDIDWHSGLPDARLERETLHWGPTRPFQVLFQCNNIAVVIDARQNVALVGCRDEQLSHDYDLDFFALMLVRNDKKRSSSKKDITQTVSAVLDIAESLAYLKTGGWHIHRPARASLSSRRHGWSYFEVCAPKQDPAFRWAKSGSRLAPRNRHRSLVKAHQALLALPLSPPEPIQLAKADGTGSASSPSYFPVREASIPHLLLAKNRNLDGTQLQQMTLEIEQALQANPHTNALALVEQHSTQLRLN